MNRMQTLGRFTLSWKPPQLREGGRLVKLTPKQFKTLALLVQARGRVVSKQVFLEKVWKDSVVEEGNLTQTIFLLRRALGKLPGGSDYIDTVPGRGYCLSSEALGFMAPADPGNEHRPVVFAQGQLRQDEQLRLLVDSIEDYAIYMLDCAGRVVTWNTGAARNKGYKSEEVIGQHYSMFFVPEDIERCIPDQALSLAAKQGRCSGEGWRIRKNGERFWASYVITAIRGQAGKLIGFAKVMRDLSERKRQEDALLRMDALLRRERDRLNAAAECSMDALFICEAVRDPTGEIEDFTFVYLNGNAERMTAIPPDILRRSKMKELLPLHHAEGLFEAYKRVVITGEPHITELRTYPEDQSPRWLRVRAVRLEDGIAVSASDITDRKHAEERIAELVGKYESDAR